MNKRICLVCKKEHYEEYDRYFCSKVCEKRWDVIIHEKVLSYIDKIEWESKHTFYSDDGVICPFCEHEHEAIGWTELYDENLDQFECENCGVVFSVTANVSWSWESKPLDSDYERIEE